MRKPNMTTKPDRVREMADAAMKKMAEWCESGLPECYWKGKNEAFSRDAMHSALYDWFMDLPWNDKGRTVAYEYILNDEDHSKTLDQVLRVFKYDLRKIIEDDLKGGSAKLPGNPPRK